jgi:large subunit ribosomal protein L24
MYFCGSCHKGVRVGFRQQADGGKERFCKSCGASLGTVGRSKAARRAAAT